MSNVQQLLIDHLDIWTAADSAKKTGRGRSSGNAASVYGIKKLRELILELAVRGKLVPQDPNDEPASELLKRIQAEKAKLVAEGKIKKDKSLLPINDYEIPFELPQGWVWTTLASISLINPRNNAEDNCPASFVTMRMIGAGFNSMHDHEIRLWKEIKKGYTHFAECDIGIAKITPCFENSKACVFSGLENGIGAGTTELHIVRPINLTLAPRYVLAYLKSPQFLLVGETRMTGTAGQKRLPKEFVELNPFPLPPLAEQHRVVAKVDELMALCDQFETQHTNAAVAHENLVSQLLSTLTQSQRAEDFNANWQRIAANFDTLFTTEASIDALKQILLQLAVMGKLVPQDPNDEPASELLKRIQAEKAKLIAEGKIKKDKPLPPITDEEKPFELPQGWAWTTLAFISLINPRNNAEDDCSASFVTMAMIGVGFNSMHDHEIRLWKEIKQGFTHFAESDIGVAKITPCFENSKACVFSGLENGIGAGTTELHIVRPINLTLAPRYVLAYLKSPQFLLVGETKMTGTAGQKRLPKEFVELNPFPLPPLAEQHRIVIKVDELMALCGQLQSRIAGAAQLQQKLADVLIKETVSCDSK